MIPFVILSLALFIAGWQLGRWRDTAAELEWELSESRRINAKLRQDLDYLFDQKQQVTEANMGLHALLNQHERLNDPEVFLAT